MKEGNWDNCNSIINKCIKKKKKNVNMEKKKKEESVHTLALTGFHCFSGHITLRMVLIYYAQVHFRWLPFTVNKGEDVANYIKKEGYLQM